MEVDWGLSVGGIGVPVGEGSGGEFSWLGIGCRVMG